MAFYFNVYSSRFGATSLYSHLLFYIERIMFLIASKYMLFTFQDQAFLATFLFLQHVVNHRFHQGGFP